MVGGNVVEVIRGADYVWVDCAGSGSSARDRCAIYVDRNAESEQIAVGDTVWWQGRFAMWTPLANREKPVVDLKSGKDYDVQIPRIGHSGVSRPTENTYRNT